MAMAEFGPQDMSPRDYESLRQRQLEAAQWFSFLVQRLAVYDLTKDYDLEPGETLHGAVYVFDTSGELVVTRKTSNTNVYTEKSHLVVANPWQLYDGDDCQVRRARLVRECSYQVDRPEAFSEENLRKIEELIRSDDTIPQLTPEEEKAIEDRYLAFLGEERLRQLEEGDLPRSLVRIEPRVEIEVKLRRGPNYRSEYLATTSDPLSRMTHAVLRKSLLPVADENYMTHEYPNVIELAHRIASGHISPELPPALSE